MNAIALVVGLATSLNDDLLFRKSLLIISRIAPVADVLWARTFFDSRKGGWSLARHSVEQSSFGFLFFRQLFRNPQRILDLPAQLFTVGKV